VPKVEAQSEPTIQQIKIPSKDVLLQKSCNFIAKFEGCKLEAYKCPAGVWTIGYGHTKGVKKGDIVTSEIANDLLKQDTKQFLDCVYKEVGDICNENQIVALTSFAFNVGVGNFRGSTLLKVVKKNPKDFAGVRSEFLRWIYADGNALKGLKKRRNAEAELYKKA